MLIEQLEGLQEISKYLGILLLRNAHTSSGQQSPPPTEISANLGIFEAASKRQKGQPNEKDCSPDLIKPM